MSLTPALKKTLDFIKSHIRQHGVAPSVREVAAGIGIRSKSSAHRHVQKLHELGFLEQSPREARGILVSPDKGRIPIFGTVAAGSATEVFEQTDDFCLNNWVNADANTFALQVTGDSMVDAGIRDGDTVLCQKAETATPEQIAVVLIDHQEVTLKFCHPLSDELVQLTPANQQYHPKKYANERVEIKGYVIAQMRRYN